MRDASAQGRGKCNRRGEEGHLPSDAQLATVEPEETKMRRNVLAMRALARTSTAEGGTQQRPSIAPSSRAASDLVVAMVAERRLIRESYVKLADEGMKMTDAAAANRGSDSDSDSSSSSSSDRASPHPDEQEGGTEEGDTSSRLSVGVVVSMKGMRHRLKPTGQSAAEPEPEPVCQHENPANPQYTLGTTRHSTRYSTDTSQTASGTRELLCSEAVGMAGSGGGV